MENQSTSLKNRDFLINELGLETKNNKSVYFENEKFAVLSPGIQNERYSFDLSRSSVEKALSANKKSFLIIRYFEEFLVSELAKLMEQVLVEQNLHTYQDGRQKWSMQVREENGDLFANVYSHDKSLKLQKMNKEELKQFMTKHSKVTEIKNLPLHIHSYLTSRGFLYSKENIANLYLSLRSKPFVIISGISGTGKTKIVQLFAESVGATEESGQFRLISVRPDWSDSSDLLGYKNLQDQFVEGQLTEIVKRAHEYPALPHFVVLDEMNLARVEYYLSEFLSIMESRRVDEKGQVVSSPLVTTNDGTYSLPNNLYIIGTVNMDETTHPFSKKVLDRANTIEFNEIRLNHFAMFEEDGEEVAAVRVGNEQFESKYLYLKQAYGDNKELVQKVSAQLEKINERLQTIYAQVGYRVRDEICFYMLYNDEMQLLSEEEAFDFCIMQKILPRISGTESTVEDLLKNLYEQFAGQVYDNDKTVSESASYPRSAKKVAEMLKRLYKDGFTSFWVS